MNTSNGKLHTEVVNTLLDTLCLIDGRKLRPEVANNLLHHVRRKSFLDLGL
jgi:hypothetical protein